MKPTQAMKWLADKVKSYSKEKCPQEIIPYEIDMAWAMVNTEFHEMSIYHPMLFGELPDGALQTKDGHYFALQTKYLFGEINRIELCIRKSFWGFHSYERVGSVHVRTEKPATTLPVQGGVCRTFDYSPTFHYIVYDKNQAIIADGQVDSAELAVRSLMEKLIHLVNPSVAW